MNTQEKHQDELEYNDGLGDLLREKEQRRFSWSKTMIVLLSFVVIVFLLVSISFDFGKRLFQKRLQVSQQEIQIEHEMLTKEAVIDEQTDKLIQEIEAQETIDIEEPTITQTMSAKSMIQDTHTAKPVFTQTEVPKYKVIAGAFSSYDNAKSQVRRLNSKNIGSFIWKKETNNQVLFLVQTGAFSSESQAKNLITQLSRLEIDSYITQK
ncbi:SPOR domain-containing protein [Thermoproteota archaeon]